MGTVEIVTHGKEIGKGEYLWCDSIDQKKGCQKKFWWDFFDLKCLKKLNTQTILQSRIQCFWWKWEIFECSLFGATFDTKVTEYVYVEYGIRWKCLKWKDTRKHSPSYSSVPNLTNDVKTTPIHTKTFEKTFTTDTLTFIKVVKPMIKSSACQGNLKPNRTYSFIKFCLLHFRHIQTQDLIRPIPICDEIFFIDTLQICCSNNSSDFSR